MLEIKTPVLPLGFHVLIEVIPVQFKSKGGIITMSETEQSRESGCDGPGDWGVKIGDTVELKSRYDGKHSRTGDYEPQYKKLRYVADSDIIGVLSEELVNQLINEDK